MTDDPAILESISDGVFTVDRDFRITYLNRSAEEIIKIRREDALGELCRDVFHCNLCEGACALRQTLEKGEGIVDLSCFIINNEGRRVPVSISTAVLRDKRGRVIGGAETFRNLSDIEQLRSEIEVCRSLGDFSSRSRSMHKIFSRLQAVAGSDVGVLISGETGTGKELLARTIHAHSPRKEKPFLAVNCGAFPETLLESELFGYKKGAFTGAVRDKPGRFELAKGGTLFLDEIGEITPAMQVKLLRVLQEHTCDPLGSVKSVRTDVRIIAATNRDLEKMVREGSFRQDLFYRLNVIHLKLPPLRERREDIPFLIEQFIRRFNATLHRNISGISNSALKLLTRMDWPGNIRELENVIERSMVFCRGALIEISDLPESFVTKLLPETSGSGMIRDSVKIGEFQAIQSALRRAAGNRRKAAALLGIDHTTFYRKLKKLGIVLDLPDGRKRGKTAPDGSSGANLPL